MHGCSRSAAEGGNHEQDAGRDEDECAGGTDNEPERTAPGSGCTLLCGLVERTWIDGGV
jgi:hypothetical protein